MSDQVLVRPPEAPCLVSRGPPESPRHAWALGSVLSRIIPTIRIVGTIFSNFSKADYIRYSVFDSYSISKYIGSGWCQGPGDRRGSRLGWAQQASEVGSARCHWWCSDRVAQSQDEESDYSGSQWSPAAAPDRWRLNSLDPGCWQLALPASPPSPAYHKFAPEKIWWRRHS